MPPLESQLEKRLVEWCRRNGFLTFKFVSPNNRGVPDRIIIRNGRILFLELKQQGAKPTPLQMHEMKRLADAGCRVAWADNFDEALRHILDQLNGPQPQR